MGLPSEDLVVPDLDRSLALEVRTGTCVRANRREKTFNVASTRVASRYISPLLCAQYLLARLDPGVGFRR